MGSTIGGGAIIVDQFSKEEEGLRTVLKAIQGQRRSVANAVECIT